MCINYLCCTCFIADLSTRPNLTALVLLTMVTFGLVSLLAMTIVIKDSWTNRNDIYHVAATSNRIQQNDLIICECAICDHDKMNASSDDAKPQHLPPWSDCLVKVSKIQFFN